MHKEITTVQIYVTTFCNMKCPNCCCGMQVMDKKDKYFVDWDYMVNAAKYFYGVDTISLSGGEPSIHPQLEEWSPKLKELFGCRQLTMSTNATMFRKKPEMFGHYDKLYVTHYTEETYDGCRDNMEQILFLKYYYVSRPELLQVSQDMEHIDRAHRGTGTCFRGSNGHISYANGKLYPCCVGSGLDKEVSIALTDNWRELINEVKPPCEVCFFAEN